VQHLRTEPGQLRSFIEADLRKSKKKAEADKLRAKFKQWLNDAKKKLESDDK